MEIRSFISSITNAIEECLRNSVVYTYEKAEENDMFFKEKTYMYYIRKYMIKQIYNSSRDMHFGKLEN